MPRLPCRAHLKHCEQLRAVIYSIRFQFRYFRYVFKCFE
ncbi:unnamed protein product [Brugia timori]|uniref:Uncharacterized protein n=1 Tax=Brugia timori TaxID=42155 RepID=A0A0R3QWB2_9BILA|nr:unnamed protein product [Brugia timori]